MSPNAPRAWTPDDSNVALKNLRGNAAGASRVCDEFCSSDIGTPVSSRRSYLRPTGLPFLRTLALREAIGVLLGIEINWERTQGLTTYIPSQPYLGPFKRHTLVNDTQM